MSSGTEVAKQSVRATFILTTGNVVSTGILTVTVLIIARLLGPSNYGQYTLALVIPNFLQLLAGVGVNAAVTRYSAFHISKGELETARRMTKNAILFLLFFGLLLSALNYLGAGFFSSTILHRPELTPYLEIASIFVVGQALLQCVIAAFIGWNLTGYASASTISQSALKLLVSPTLVLLGFGVLGAVFAHVASYLIVGSFAGVAIFVLRLKSNSKSHGPGNDFIEDRIRQVKSQENIVVANIQPAIEGHLFFSDIKEMIRYGLPAFAGSVASLLSGQFYIVIILATITTNITIGHYQAALNVTQTIALISSAVALSLFPAFARLDGMNVDIRLAFTYSVKYVSLVLTPLVFFLLGTSSVLIGVFYGAAYSPAADYMNVLALSYLPLALGLTVMPPFFNGIGKTRLTMVMLLAGAATVIVLAPVLGVILGLGVDGLILSLIISNLLSSLIGVYFAKKYADARIDYRIGARIFVASYVCFGALFFLSMLGFGKYVSLPIDILAFFGLYLTLVPVLRVVSKEDLNRLKISASGLGFISKVLNPILWYENFLIEKTIRGAAKKAAN